MQQESHPILAREGRVHIIVAALATFTAWVLWGVWAALPFAVFLLFVLQFFRDPPRITPQDRDIVVAPADGKVIRTGEEYDPYLDRNAFKISIFMNVFNVHSNRIPVSGRVTETWYNPGRFFNAALDKASLENERNALRIQMQDGQEVTCVQVAGLVARRIMCYSGKDDEVRRGQRYGFIRFGSRVDLYLPERFEPAVDCGVKTVGGETVLGRLKPSAGDASSI